MQTVRRLAVLLLVVLVGCGDDGAAGSQSTTTTEAPPPVLSPDGFGGLRIGMTVDDARATGEAEGFGPGCELVGPGQVVADLVEADGFAAFHDDVLTNLHLRSGATAEGFEVGGSLDELRAVYDDVEVDETTEEVFGFWIARAGGYAGIVDPVSERVDAVATPDVLLCD